MSNKLDSLTIKELCIKVMRFGLDGLSDDELTILDSCITHERKKRREESGTAVDRLRTFNLVRNGLLNEN